MVTGFTGNDFFFGFTTMRVSTYAIATNNNKKKVKKTLFLFVNNFAKSIFFFFSILVNCVDL